ncbi:MAG TPA: PQQ-dependent dehydrogenase, methanol/ethanol family [Novosphingobium sp.]|nr:PQQ-dependent dehydrogenase, methanol/ethanol family [Novosphingobium sp.]
MNSVRRGLESSGMAAGLCLSAMLGLAGCDGPSGISPHRRSDGAASFTSLRDESHGRDWPAYGRTYGEQHYSPLSQIKVGNVGRLGLAWSLDLPIGNTVTQPLEVGGILYFTVGYSVIHAVDAVTGKELWTFDPKAPEAAGERMRSSWGSRGLGYWNGKVYTGTVDGRLIAVDAGTGKQVWARQTLEPGSLAFITGAPRLFDGKVVIGHGGADISAARGYVTTYDAETGRMLWRFYTVPGDPAKGFEDNAQAMAAKTWSGKWWEKGGGGTAWNSFAYDPETRTLFLGTGNGAPWNPRVRSDGKGDNLFLCSIVALDARTGRYKWHYQINPAEAWDYNAAMDLHLARIEIAGKARKVLITAPKNGFLYVLDQSTGRLISADQIVRVTWASRINLKTGRPVENPAARYAGGKPFELWPSQTGAHAALPSAFSPQTGLVYIPLIEQGVVIDEAGIVPARWRRRPHGQFDPAANVGSGKGRKLREGTSALLAWDPARSKAAWKVPTPKVWNGGILATGGGLVFQGQAQGLLNAYDARTGTRLWSFAAQAAVLAPPISFKVGGRQYVTVLTGTGLSAGLDASALPRRFDYRGQARRVLTFALGSRAAIAPSASFRLEPAADPEYRPDPAAEARGAALTLRCFVCHGAGMDAGGGVAPDLRVSPVPQSAEAFDRIVRHGALVPQGMPAFPELSDAQTADLRQYLRSKGAELHRR